MDLSSLQYFITTAQYEHMGKAAEQLHITQPTLSVAIKRLEAEVGYRLFDRSGRGIQLNAYGRQMLETAVKIESEISHCIAEMERIRFNTVEYFRISAASIVVDAELAGSLLARGIRLKLMEMSGDWESQLLQNRCDLVITMLKSEMKEIDTIELKKLKLVAVAGCKHPAASLPEMSVKDIIRYPFCSVSAPHMLIDFIRRIFPYERFDPHVAFLGRNMNDTLEALRSGRYLAILSEDEAARHPDIKKLNVRDLDLAAPLYLYRRSSDAGKEDLENVIDAIQEYYQI